jgi:Flp pilus assembly protein TadB
VIAWLAAAGAVTGIGLAVVLAALRPAPPRLDAVLAYLDLSAAGTPPKRVPAVEGIGVWLATHLARPGRLAIPRADLALLGRPAETYLTHTLAAGLAGLVSFAFAGAALSMLGAGLPWQVPAIAAIAGGVGMFFFPDADVRAEAARRRVDFHHAFIAYLQLVRLARAAGAGTNEALEHAARTGDGWPFQRIRTALEEARAAREPPWRHLAELGERIGVADLAELAAAIEVAGSEGAKIAVTLEAKTGSLRGEIAAARRAKANARSTTMIVPLSLLGLGLVVLMAYPAFANLIYGT